MSGYRPNSPPDGQTKNGGLATGDWYLSTGHLPSSRQVQGADDLAVMSATLADGGVNPVTGLRVVTPAVSRQVLAVMATAGMYETSGDWLFDIGVPGKSGISGGIIAVSPGKGGLGTFSPLLDRAGNSVRGQLVARHLSRTLGLTLFASKAYRSAPLATGSPRRLSVQDPGLLLVELGLGQDAGLQQLAELRQLGEPLAHVGRLGRRGGCLRRRGRCRDGWRHRRRGGCGGLVLGRPPGLLPALDPSVYRAGHGHRGRGLQYSHRDLLSFLRTVLWHRGRRRPRWLISRHRR
jgi:hypothetical protein